MMITLKYGYDIKKYILHEQIKICYICQLLSVAKYANTDKNTKIWNNFH